MNIDVDQLLFYYFVMIVKLEKVDLRKNLKSGRPRVGPEISEATYSKHIY